MSIQATHPYENGLDKNAANYVPLTPIGFLLRTASVYRTGLLSPMESGATVGAKPFNAAAGSQQR